MTETSETLSSGETAGRLDGGAFVHLGGRLYAQFSTRDFATAARLVDAVGEAAEVLGHHPDIRLGYGTAAFTLTSHDAGGVTERDLDLAARIQSLADDVGAIGQQRAPSVCTIAIDAIDAESIRPFWRVGLGYEERRGDEGEVELVDPAGQGPTVWFQQMHTPRTERNRIHLDVYLPAKDAEARVRAVEGAGGRLVTAEHAPGWWVMSDVEGNELCVCSA